MALYHWREIEQIIIHHNPMPFQLLSPARSTTTFSWLVQLRQQATLSAKGGFMLNKVTSREKVFSAPASESCLVKAFHRKKKDRSCFPLILIFTVSAGAWDPACLFAWMFLVTEPFVISCFAFSKLSVFLQWRIYLVLLYVQCVFSSRKRTFALVKNIPWSPTYDFETSPILIVFF